MGSSRRFKPPWTLVRENSECYVVRDANGVTLAWLYCRDDTQRYSVGVSKLTSEEARRIGNPVLRIGGADACTRPARESTQSDGRPPLRFKAGGRVSSDFLALWRLIRHAK